MRNLLVIAAVVIGGFLVLHVGKLANAPDPPPHGHSNSTAVTFKTMQTYRTVTVTPDAVVAQRGDLSGVRLTRPPLLVAEILSPDSALRDLNLKKAAYERFGIPSYWVIDPDLDQPSLRAFELVDGAYREAAQAAGDVPYRAERPFPVEIVPSHLVAKLRSQ